MKKFSFFFVLLFGVQVSAQIIPSLPDDLGNGVFLINEGWFGHEGGSVNFLTDDGEMHYRVYSAANPEETLGMTTGFGCIHEGKFYFVSKQGIRLVVADAFTLEKIASFEDVGGGDGRSFLGVDADKGYISTSTGIYVFDIRNMTVGKAVEGSMDNRQVGIMVKAGGRVFAAKQGTGVCIIDPEEDRVTQTIEAKNVFSLAVSKDGQVWAALTGTASRLLRIDPLTLDTAGVALPGNITLADAWGAWNAGSLCAAHRTNTLYFATGGGMFGGANMIVRYDIDNNVFDTDFFVLPNQEGQYKEEFYGAAFRVNPQNDQLVLMAVESGWGEHFTKNWLHFVDGATGQLLNTVEPVEHYWFPALPVFPDTSSGDGGGDIVTHVGEAENTECSVYPNPVIDRLHVNVGEPLSGYLYSLSGNLLWKGRLQVGVSTIDMSNMPPGVYTLTVGGQVVRIIRK